MPYPTRVGPRPRFPVYSRKEKSWKKITRGRYWSYGSLYSYVHAFCRERERELVCRETGSAVKIWPGAVCVYSEISVSFDCGSASPAGGVWFVRLHGRAVSLGIPPTRAPQPHAFHCLSAHLQTSPSFPSLVSLSGLGCPATR